MRSLVFYEPQTTVIVGDIKDIINAAIPNNTWLWKTNEGAPNWKLNRLTYNEMNCANKLQRQNYSKISYRDIID